MSLTYYFYDDKYGQLKNQHQQDHQHNQRNWNPWNFTSLNDQISYHNQRNAKSDHGTQGYYRAIPINIESKSYDQKNKKQVLQYLSLFLQRKNSLIHYLSDLQVRWTDLEGVSELAKVKTIPNRSQSKHGLVSNV